MRNVTGLTGAAPIWHEIMRTVLQGQPDRPFPRPEGLVQLEVCDLSGLLPTPACPHTKLEWFIEGTQPSEYDPFYKQVWVDALTGQLATECHLAGTPPAAHRARFTAGCPGLGENAGLTLVGIWRNHRNNDQFSSAPALPRGPG
jgi:membrane carboxypeptidase/penicillin-binding protein PbpC